MHLDELAKLIDAEISTGELMANIEALQALDRFFTFPKFVESARLVAKKLADCGLDSQVLEQPADGVTRVGDWTMPLAWDCREASLELVEPEAQRGKVLCRRTQDPTCLVMWSAPTAAEGVVAELVGPVEVVWERDDVPPRLQLAGRDGPRPLREGELAGKIVFCQKNPRVLKALAAKAGAAGMVTSYMHPRQNLPENRAWINGWADDPSGWAFTAADQPMWCFVLTPRQGEELKALLAAGPVKARAAVDSRIYEGVLPAATGLLRGKSNEEILLLGHQFEIGADDNASGCAALLEAARVMAGLIARGALPEPRRSVRFLFAGECYGSLAYALANERQTRRTLAGMNLDCVGGDQRKVNMPLPVSLTPAANPSVADTLILRLCEGYLQKRDPFFVWRRAGFAPCDSAIGDPMIGIPVVYLGGKDRFWHTTADSIDKIDPQAAARSATLAAAFAYYLAAASSEEAEWLAEETAADGRRELARLGARFAAELRSAPAAERGATLWRAQESLAWARETTIERVRSAQKFAAHSERREFRQALRPMASQLKKQAKNEESYLRGLAARLAEEAGEPAPQSAPPPRPDWWAEAERLVPVRKVPGTVTFEGLSAAEREGYGGGVRWSSWLANVLFRCDGRRTLAEALSLGTLDTGAPEGISAEPMRLFRLLERGGLIELRAARKSAAPHSAD